MRGVGECARNTARARNDAGRARPSRVNIKKRPEGPEHETTVVEAKKKAVKTRAKRTTEEESSSSGSQRR